MLKTITTTAALLLALASPALALELEKPSTFGAHLVSVHGGGRGEPARGWNNVNPGMYLRWHNGLTVGAFHNSEWRTSAYAGWTFSDSADRFSVTAGLVTGYQRAAVMPLLVPSVRIGLNNNTSARLSLLAPPKGAPAIHLSVERRF